MQDAVFSGSGAIIWPPLDTSVNLPQNERNKDMSKVKSKSKTAKQRSKKKPSEFTILLKQFHKHSKRHVLILEANISDDFLSFTV